MTAKLKCGIIKVKDPGNALTHFIAMILAITVVILLFLKAGHDSGHMRISTLATLILSMIGLYAVGMIYYTLDTLPRINKLLRKINHMMILILIVGTYTPVCTIVLGGKTDWTMLALVRSIVTVGILINALWITCPKWFSSLIYIVMGWVRILVITEILSSMSRADFTWLPTDGIIHIAGGIIYAMKLSFLNSRHRYFGSHEVFHLSVMGRSLCHHMMMCRFVA